MQSYRKKGFIRKIDVIKRSPTKKTIFYQIISQRG